MRTHFQLSDRRNLREGYFRKYLPFMEIMLLLVTAAGCTSGREYFRNGFKVGPNYTKPAAPVADDWVDSSDPNVEKIRPDDAAWWRTFNDPTLDDLIHQAYQQNLTLRVAGLRILEARAQRDIAAGGLFPQSQQAYGSYSRTNLSRNAPTAAPSSFFDEWKLGTNLAWELDFWGRFRRAVESANANLDASVENYDDVLVILLAEVAQQYASLRTAEQRLEYAKQNAEIQRESLGIADAKYQNGATSKLDVTQGQANLSQTLAAIPPMETARRQAANQLCILMGMPPQNIDAMLSRTKMIPTAPPHVAVGVPAELLRRRPDVRRAERQVAAQSAQIGIAQSELYPHFSITGNIYVDSKSVQNLFESGSVAGSIGPSFQWNILNYGRIVNGVRVQDARFQQLVVTYQNTVLQANAEAENAMVAFLKAQQQVKDLADSAEASKQSVGLVRDQYNAGKADFNRVLTVEQQLTVQQDQLANAQGSVAKNLVLLYKALGGGWQIRLGGTEPQPLPAPNGAPRPAQPDMAPTIPEPPTNT